MDVTTLIEQLRELVTENANLRLALAIERASHPAPTAPDTSVPDIPTAMDPTDA